MIKHPLKLAKADMTLNTAQISHIEESLHVEQSQ